METAGISSFKELSRRAAVSEWQIKLLRQGQAANMRANALYRVSRALQTSMVELLECFSDVHSQPDEMAADPDAAIASYPSHPIPSPPPLSNPEPFKEEYQRLQAQLVQQREALWQEFQQASLQALESWLIQFPTAAHAAQNNPQVPATRLLPLMRPVEQLLKDWQVEAIAPVGAELPYDPQQHQLMEGSANPGDRVKVRYTGYKQGNRLLYRAKVSPIAKQ